MTEFIISDTHFDDNGNIILYENRPFENWEKMTEALIKNWNSVVKLDDKVFHLGDVGMSSKEILSHIIPRLSGRLYLIKGNHDRKHSNKWYRDLGFTEIYEYPIIIDGYLILSHEPVYLNHNTPYRNIHGHIHSVKMDSDLYFNASVECINYTPITKEQIIEKTKWYVDKED